jgi:hypothetical protein
MSNHYGNTKSGSRRHAQHSSRPGVQRSDHSSASVMQLDIDNSCHSFYSVSSASMVKHISTLTRKESVRPGSCLDFNNGSISRKNNSVVVTTSPSIHTVTSKKTVVRFAPSSEILYIPIPSRIDLSMMEIENKWYTSKDYEVQRLSNETILYLMEQEIQKLSGNDSITAITFSSFIGNVQGARGLEQRTKLGATICYQNRQKSIQAVLQEQKYQNQNGEYDDYSKTKIQQQLEQRLATVYSKETMLATQDAIERAIFDAGEADMDVKILNNTSIIPMVLSPTRPSNKSISTCDFGRQYIPSLFQENTPCVEFKESIHSLSPSRKLRHYNQREQLPSPKPTQRQSSFSMLSTSKLILSNRAISVSQHRETLHLSNHSQKKVLNDPLMCMNSNSRSSHHSKIPSTSQRNNKCTTRQIVI